jgi:hypothetical protein
MSRAPLPFKQTDLTRAIKAAQAAGLKSYRIEIRNGFPSIVIDGDAHSADKPDDKAASWDSAIAELERRASAKVT